MDREKEKFRETKLPPLPNEYMELYNEIQRVQRDLARFTEVLRSSTEKLEQRQQYIKDLFEQVDAPLQRYIKDLAELDDAPLQRYIKDLAELDDAPLQRYIKDLAELDDAPLRECIENLEQRQRYIKDLFEQVDAPLRECIKNLEQRQRYIEDLFEQVGAPLRECIKNLEQRQRYIKDLFEQVSAPLQRYIKDLFEQVSAPLQRYIKDLAELDGAPLRECIKNIERQWEAVKPFWEFVHLALQARRGDKNAMLLLIERFVTTFWLFPAVVWRILWPAYRQRQEWYEDITGRPLSWAEFVAGSLWLALAQITEDTDIFEIPQIVRRATRSYVESDLLGTRLHKVRKEVPLSEKPPPKSLPAARGVERAEMRMDIEGALADLPRRYRDAYFAEKRGGDNAVAKHYMVKVGTVRKWRHEAREHIRKKLGKDYLQ